MALIIMRFTNGEASPSHKAGIEMHFAPDREVSEADRESVASLGYTKSKRDAHMYWAHWTAEREEQTRLAFAKRFKTEGKIKAEVKAAMAKPQAPVTTTSSSKAKAPAKTTKSSKAAEPSREELIKAFAKEFREANARMNQSVERLLTALL